MYSDEAIAIYQELRREGLRPEEAAELTNELLGETYAGTSSKGGSLFGSLVLLCGMLLCVALTIGGL